MKRNKVQYGTRQKVTLALGAGIAIVLIVGIVLGYGKLRDIWLEQCVITDMDRQVSIASGKMVKADVIAEAFGLKCGANLALIDFDEKRKALLANVPNLKSVSVSRTLPDKVSIAIEERTPIARLNPKGRKTVSGHVTDAEGVVFICQRGTSVLPTIYETSPVPLAPGSRLGGRMLAALQLIEVCREPGFLELGVLDVDASKPDFITATLGNYSQAKVAWEGMDDPTPGTRKNLVRQLTLLVKAIRSNVGENTVIWNATDTSEPGCIYADSKGNN